MLAVDDAVVHLHVERIIERLIVAVKGIVSHQHGVFVFVVLVGIPIVGDGAVHETVVTAKGPEVGKAAVGDDEVLGLNGIEDGEKAVTALVFDDGVVDAQSAFRRFQHRLAVEADGAVTGVADAVVGTGATVHHQDLFPLPRGVVVIGLQTVALHDDGFFRSSVDDELTVAPRKDAAALVAINLRAFFNFQGAVTVDERIAIDDVRSFRSPNCGL